MTDKDFYSLVDFVNAGGGLLPVNSKAHDILDATTQGEIISFKSCTARDIKFHRCYMSLLAFIWGYMPNKFKKSVSKEKFYLWLKHLKGHYEILFKFKDGTKLVEYESISFSKMDQVRFEEYIREQLPWIYSDVIGKYYKVGGWRYNKKINDIESEYEKFLSKL